MLSSSRSSAPQSPHIPSGAVAKSEGLLVLFRRLAGQTVNSRLGREALWSLGLKIVYTGFAFLSTIMLARLLGAAGYGVYAWVYALTALLSVPSQFGLPNLVLRETARGMAKGDYGTVKGVWTWSGRIALGISLGLVGLAALAAWLFREAFPGERLTTFAWALALVPLVVLGKLRGAALQGLHRIIEGQLPENLVRPALLVLLMAGETLLFGHALSPGDAMVLHVLAAAVAFGAGTWMLWRATPNTVRFARPLFENKAWFLSTLPLAIIAGLNLVNRQADILILGFFVPPADIGVYRVAAQTSLLACFGLEAMNMVVAPRFAHLYARGEMARLQRIVTASARGILGFNLAVTGGFVVLGRPLLRVVFGPAYEAAYLPLMILLGGQMINSAAGSVGFLLNMTGHEREAALGMGVAAALNILLNLLLIPLWGIQGAAVATGVSLIAWNVLLSWKVRKRLGINSLAFDMGGDKFEKA